MPRMVVTPEVSQLDMSELNNPGEFRWENPEPWGKELEKKRALMSVMAETSQSAMSLKAAGLALNAWTAAFREAVLVKVPGGEGGGSHALPVASRWKPASHSQSQPRT